MDNNVLLNQRERYTIKEAIDEAKRCLNCKIPQCKLACPIGNNIPDFIHALSMGNMGMAMKIINEKSNLPAICGRVCPHEKQCQGNCVLGKKGKPVQIGKLEEFIADFDTDMNLIREKLPQKDRGKIAVIGSGPAGLTVAGDLARKGFGVVIFEGQEEPGGVLTYGIPNYRLPKSVVRKEIAKIEALGVHFVLNCLVGTNGLTIDKIFEKGFDAIFIGTGTALPQDLHGVPGTQLRGVSHATYLLHCLNSYIEGAIDKDAVPLRKGDKVAIIGCGNVAMDAARTSLRYGADVTIIYRGDVDKMPANKSEYNEAVAEGVKFLWNASPVEFFGDDRGQVFSARINVNGTTKDIPFNRIFIAIGSRPANRIVSTTDGIEVDDYGYVKVSDKPFGMTTKIGVFAGGDVVHHPQTVVLAMKAAKQVAVGIEQYVDAVKLIENCKMIENKTL